jgi:glycosyltransferase involved in cell wall biosynthesis
MRVLHVIQQLGVGGAERVMLALVRGAQEEGHEVSVAAAPGALVAEAGVPVHPLPLVERRLRRVPLAAAAVARAVRSERPDVVHVHNPAMALAAGMATLRGRRPRSLVSVHGVPSRDDRATARTLRLAGLPVVACGPAIAEALTAQRVPLLATIPNGVPAPPPPSSKASVRAEWNLDAERRLVLSVGRLAPEKNHSSVIEAIASVPDAVLAIVGAGPTEAELRSQAAGAGVADRVVFAGARADAWQLMGAADAVVLASRGEGMPLTVLEALAIGTPLVATRVRGIVGLVEDGRTAMLVPEGDAAALAAALERVLTDAELASRLVSAGRKHAEGFDERRMTSAYLQLYSRVVVRSPGLT